MGALLCGGGGGGMGLSSVYNCSAVVWRILRLFNIYKCLQEADLFLVNRQLVWLNRYDFPCDNKNYKQFDIVLCD